MISNISVYAENMDDLEKYRKLGTITELSKRLNEEEVLKFYYCESEDKYLVGQRHGTLYYGEVGKTGITFYMSRYLPWGKGKYPTEPKEIPFFEWISGFLNQKGVKLG